MTVLNTFLAVAGWAWTALVICFAAGYALARKAAAQEAGGAPPAAAPSETANP